MRVDTCVTHLYSWGEGGREGRREGGEGERKGRKEGKVEYH